MCSITFVAWLIAMPPGRGAESLQAPTPIIELDQEISGTSRAFIVVSAKTNGSAVQWVAIDPGLTLIPPQLLRDSKTAVLMAERAGRFRLLAFTALGDTPSAPAITTIVVDSPSPPPNPARPPQSDATIWAVVVQPDGPLSPDLAANRKHPAWARLKERGVQLSWMEISAVDPTYANEIKGLTPPILLVLQVRSLNGKSVSTVISRQSLPTPEVAERLVLEALR